MLRVENDKEGISFSDAGHNCESVVDKKMPLTLPFKTNVIYVNTVKVYKVL